MLTVTRSMLDSVTAADIPASFRDRTTELVAGYVDGRYAWSQSDWDMHARAGRRLVRIATRPGTNDGHVLDIEPGNADASATPSWARLRRAAGLATPTVYCFSDAGPAGYRISDVRRAFAHAGEPPPLFWIAKWDNDPSTFDPSGDASIIAKQYAGSQQTRGHFDASVVADDWPGVDTRAEVALEHVLPAIWMQRAALGYNPWTGEPIDPKGELPGYAKPPLGWRDPYR